MCTYGYMEKGDCPTRANKFFRKNQKIHALCYYHTLDATWLSDWEDISHGEYLVMKIMEE